MAAPLAVSEITLDFGNTLVRVDRAGLHAVVDATADALAGHGLVPDRDAFLVAWAEERERQFREEVPEFREVDIDQRAVRVLARQRGMAPPPPEGRWDDVAAAALVAPEEVGVVVESYSRAFIDHMSPVDDAAATLQRLHARGFALAVLSNWPLALTVDRFCEAQGWMPWLRAVVVSQRVGLIKPHPAIFRAAEAALGIDAATDGTDADSADAADDARHRILHVGDDWAADVVGAAQAGWRTAYLRGRQVDTPLPTSTPGEDTHDGLRIRPDLEIDELAELDQHVELLAGRTVGAPGASG